MMPVTWPVYLAQLVALLHMDMCSIPIMIPQHQCLEQHGDEPEDLLSPGSCTILTSFGKSHDVY